jgi:hypothetical protein
LEEGMVAKMLGLAKPIDLWVTYFLSLSMAFALDRLIHVQEMSGSASAESGWGEVGAARDTTSLEDFERVWTMLWTPKKLKVDPVLAMFMDTSPSDGVVFLEVLGDLGSLPAGIS